MGLFADIVSLFEAGYGWLFVTLLVAYELYAPVWLNQDTALAPIVQEVPEKVDDLASEQEKIREDVDAVQKQNEVAMQVQRAQARASEGMDHEEVDNYLLENGVTPDTFLTDSTDDRYRADGGDTDDEETDDSA